MLVAITLPPPLLMLHARIFKTDILTFNPPCLRNLKYFGCWNSRSLAWLLHPCVWFNCFIYILDSVKEIKWLYSNEVDTHRSIQNHDTIKKYGVQHRTNTVTEKRSILFINRTRNTDHCDYYFKKDLKMNHQ